MSVSRRKFFGYGAAAALAPATGLSGQSQAPVPAQVASDRPRSAPGAKPDSVPAFDMRQGLSPRRLTLAMWDVAYALRHQPGGSFANYDRVLDEAVERGYNTLRIDPMPQWIDLSRPERILDWPDPKQPYMPWNWNTAVSGPVGEWVIDFMEKLLRRPSLHYTLSGWWFMPGLPTSPGCPPALRTPVTMADGAEMWAVQLREWKKRFGFDRLVYVDIANETPYFFPRFQERLKEASGQDFGELAAFSPRQSAFLAQEINNAIKPLRQEFPEVRFTTSIHGDLRWLDVPLELDCLDVHFYADADPRWTERTRFDQLTGDHFLETDRWFKEFSDRSRKTAAAMAPMLRARQRFKMQEFAAWAQRRGTPLTTSEAWSSWFYIDHKDLDWGWLLDWSAWSCDDAIACGFWGWTPHNYAQPQFANWKDVAWHRRLNERFLKS